MCVGCTLVILREKIDSHLTYRWIRQFADLRSRYKWVQIFENKGATMGCSNPHPHCQIWACSFLPNEAAVKERNLREYYHKYGRPLLDDYVEKELIRRERIVIENPDWLVVVPYWAAWPFETMIISRKKLKRIDELNDKQKKSLSVVIKELTTKYDNLFKCSFPYSMGFHGMCYIYVFRCVLNCAAESPMFMVLTSFRVVNLQVPRLVQRLPMKTHHIGHCMRYTIRHY